MCRFYLTAARQFIGCSVRRTDARPSRICCICAITSAPFQSPPRKRIRLGPIAPARPAAAAFRREISPGQFDRLILGEQDGVINADPPASGEPATILEVDPASALLHRYVDDQKKRLSVVLCDLYEFLNDRASPAQLAVHEVLRGFPYRIETEGSESLKKRPSEIRAVFSTTRDYLISHFMYGNHYYADEIQYS